MGDVIDLRKARPKKKEEPNKTSTSDEIGLKSPEQLKEEKEKALRMREENNKKVTRSYRLTKKPK